MTAPFREGQFFLLPLGRATGQFAIGLIARVPPRGGVLLGYFFGPRRREPPGDQWLNGLHAHHAVLACRFKDSQLYRHEWKLLGMRAAFDRAQWPVPAFHRFDGTATQVPGSQAVQDWRVEYSDTNLITPVSEMPASAADCKLVDDLVYDATLLSDEVGRRVTDAVPTADDTSWR